MTGRFATSRFARLSGAGPIGSVLGAPLSLLYRCFLLPADITGYRAILGRYQAISADLSGPVPQAASEVAREAGEIEGDLTSRRAGNFPAVMAPSLKAVLQSWW